jgi:hypothetical protein
MLNRLIKQILNHSFFNTFDFWNRQYTINMLLKSPLCALVLTNTKEHKGEKTIYFTVLTAQREKYLVGIYAWVIHTSCSSILSLSLYDFLWLLTDSPIILILFRSATPLPALAQ